ncbi:MAG: hypothetical protein ACRDRV_04400 [Pseudonocardiaceae bacterium]
MRIRTDDEVYRVDSVWLGPPKATFPWRTRYVSWGVGMVVFLLVLGVERQLGIGFGFFSTAWGLLITILITRLIGSRISHERPLTAVAAMVTRELITPRESKTAAGGAASAARIRVQRNRPRPGQRRSRRFGRARKSARKEEPGVRARTSAQTGTASRE